MPNQSFGDGEMWPEIRLLLHTAIVRFVCMSGFELLSGIELVDSILLGKVERKRFGAKKRKAVNRTYKISRIHFERTFKLYSFRELDRKAREEWPWLPILRKMDAARSRRCGVA